MERLIIRSQSLPGHVALARRLKARVPELTCRVCQHRDFAMVEFPDEGFRSQLSRHSSADEQLAISQPLITVVCTSCGHLEQFAEAVIGGAAPKDYGEDHTNG